MKRLRGSSTSTGTVPVSYKVYSVCVSHVHETRVGKMRMHFHVCSLRTCASSASCLRLVYPAFAPHMCLAMRSHTLATLGSVREFNAGSAVCGAGLQVPQRYIGCWKTQNRG